MAGWSSIFIDAYTFSVENKLPERLKALRAEKRISQAKLSEELGFAPSFFASVELGKNSVSVETLMRLADYFDCSMDYLVGRKGS